MQFLLKNKILLAVIAVVVLGGALYFNLSGDNGALLQSTQSGDISSPVSRELLVTLSDLKNVTLSQSVFEDPSFKSLVDFGIEIPLQPVGRRNPFAPLGTQAPTRTQATTTGR